MQTLESGFTLIELLVVVSIIALLSSIAVASLNQTRSKARDAKRVSDLKTLSTAIELYYDTNNVYPVARGSDTTYAGTFWYQACPSSDATFSGNAATMPSADCWSNTANSERLAAQLTPYLAPIPMPPNNGTTITDCSGGSGHSVYMYQRSPTGSDYKIWGWLEKDCTNAQNDGGIRPGAFEIFSPGGQGYGN